MWRVMSFFCDLMLILHKKFVLTLLFTGAKINYIKQERSATWILNTIFHPSNKNLDK